MAQPKILTKKKVDTALRKLVRKHNIPKTKEIAESMGVSEQSLRNDKELMAYINKKNQARCFKGLRQTKADKYFREIYKSGQSSQKRTLELVKNILDVIKKEKKNDCSAYEIHAYSLETETPLKLGGLKNNKKVMKFIKMTQEGLKRVDTERQRVSQEELNKYAKKNKKICKEKARKWRRNSYQKMLETKPREEIRKMWMDKYKHKYELNPQKMNWNSLKTKANRRLRVPKWLTKEDKDKIKAVYQISRTLTLLTGNKHSVDHIIPLQAKHVSGLHVPSNLKVCLLSDNNSKLNKWSGEMGGFDDDVIKIIDTLEFKRQPTVIKYRMYYLYDYIKDNAQSVDTSGFKEYSHFKKAAVKVTNIAEGTISRDIKNLMEVGLLRRKKNGIYYVIEPKDINKKVRRVA